MFSVVNGQFAPSGNQTKTIFTTDDVGIGTDVPKSKTEIFYCDPKSGLYITKNYCPTTNSTDTYYGGLSSGGLLGDTYVEATGNGGVGTNVISQFPVYFNPFLPQSIPYSIINTTSKPMLWVRTFFPQSISSPAINLLIVMDNGKTGINVTDPRAMLDVNQPTVVYNQISAIYLE